MRAAPPSAALTEAAKVLLEAAAAYWSVLAREQGAKAVVWLEDAAGRLLVFSRGEYRAQLFANILPCGEPKYFQIQESEDDE